MMSTINVFFAGAITAGFVVASLFFFSFWRRTADSLFAAFGCAFLLFAANQALVTLCNIPVEYRSGAYLLRLAGFALLIVAIVRKNVRRAPIDRP